MNGYRHRTVFALLVASLVVLLAILVVLAPPARDGAAPGPDRPQPLAESATGSVRAVNVELRPMPATTPSATEPATTLSAPEPAAPSRDVDPGASAEIDADYGAIGFDRYLEGLKRIGARFFIVRKPAFSLVAEMDPTDLAIGRSRGPVDELSPRSRDISREPRLRRLLAGAPVTFGEGEYAAVALLPRSVERHLMQELRAIADTVSGQVDTFICSYFLSGGDLALRVSAIRTEDGRVVAVDGSVKLRTPA